MCHYLAEGLTDRQHPLSDKMESNRGAGRVKNDATEIACVYDKCCTGEAILVIGETKKRNFKGVNPSHILKQETESKFYQKTKVNKILRILHL